MGKRNDVPGTGQGALFELEPEEGGLPPNLMERFVVPPFSVLDARQGYWQGRKRAWISLGIKSELGRGEALIAVTDQSRKGYDKHPDGTPKNKAEAEQAAYEANSPAKGESTFGDRVDDMGHYANKRKAEREQAEREAFEANSGALTWTSKEVNSEGLNYYRNQKKQEQKEYDGGLIGHSSTSMRQMNEGDSYPGQRREQQAKARKEEAKRKAYEEATGKPYEANTDKPSSGALGSWGTDGLSPIERAKKYKSNAREEAERKAYEEATGKPYEANTNKGSSGALHTRIGENYGRKEMTGTSIFDPVLCEVAYRWFCPAGGRVLDPFAGGSVRGIVAAKLGRSYTGIDLSPYQVDANKLQAEEICGKDPYKPRWINGDSQHIPKLLDGDPEVDFVFSCPPYYDLEVYSKDKRDISNAGSYGDFYKAYRRIIWLACERLKQDRFAAIVIGDIRDSKTGMYRSFLQDTIEAFELAGLELYNNAVLVTVTGSLPVRVGKQFTAGRKLGRTHQYMLTFVKGDPKKATLACGDCQAGIPEDW